MKHTLVSDSFFLLVCVIQSNIFLSWCHRIVCTKKCDIVFSDNSQYVKLGQKFHKQSCTKCNICLTKVFKGEVGGIFYCEKCDFVECSKCKYGAHNSQRETRTRKK